MPPIKGKVALVDHASYCSAPPLRTSSHLLIPPRISRVKEARRPRAPIREVKREVRESEPDSSEYGIDQTDAIDIKPEAKPEVALDPRQLTVRVAAIAIRPAGTSAASSPEAPSAQLQNPGLVPRAVSQIGPRRSAPEAGPAQGIEEQAAHRSRRVDDRDATGPFGR